MINRNELPEFLYIDCAGEIQCKFEEDADLTDMWENFVDKENIKFENERLELKAAQMDNWKLRIYAVKAREETDWVCAHSILEALKKDLSTTDMVLSDIDSIEEVPENEYDSMFYVTETGVSIEKISFRQYMQNKPDVELFATTTARWWEEDENGY